MDTSQKLEILADAAKYDVACTSSGVDRGAKRGHLGTTMSAGCCHSFTPDGRCITLLKVLMTNYCSFDCAYCVNRISNDVPRTAFTPSELADLTIQFYRRNYIEGLFLSSGVIGSPDKTTELMIETLRILRRQYLFRGYIHAKTVPGTSPELVAQLGYLADRLSVNLELPSEKSLTKLCPNKTKGQLLAPMAQIHQTIEEESKELALLRRQTTYLDNYKRTGKKERRFTPAGQSTQIIIGATPETDKQILALSQSLYDTMSLKRVFFSAYLPVSRDKRLPQNGYVQLDREHRLYQADWLMRFYGFHANEILDDDSPNLSEGIDPKANWAINHLEQFPVEVNSANLDTLLRVPGIGPKGARKIIKARSHIKLREQELRKLGIAYSRARFFITCNGVHQAKDVALSQQNLFHLLAAPIQGGKHGRRTQRVAPGQLSLF